LFIDNVYFHNVAGGGPPPATEPTVAATNPSRNAANVISLFSNSYTNVPVNTWRTDWSAGTLTDLQIAGNDTKRYSNLDFVGIEAVGANSINASSMTYFHVDAWTPNMTTFKIKLVDFGANNAFGGGDDKEHELTYTPTQGQWNAYDILLTDFTGLTTKSNISQIIFVGAPAGSSTLFIDNVYFHNVAGGGSPPETVPTVAAPTPTRNAANVISLFSNAYTNVPVNTWRTDWSAATLTDLQIAGNDTKRYSNLDFVGIEAVGANSINASSMTYFHVDAWTPNMTTFKIKLVDFGANNAFGGGDDKEHELTYTPTQGQWNGYDILLTDFTGLTTKSNISQIIFVGAPAGSSTLFIDNVYFHNIAGGGSPPAPEPTVAAPTPTRNAANVISLFSNAYTNVAVNTWRTDWSEATLTDLQVAGNDTKKYSSLNFVGAEAVGPNSINATNMLYFHVDAWTPNMNSLTIKLVDFGANNVFGGGDDKEHELSFTPTKSQWNSYDILLTDFAGLTTKANISQIIFAGSPQGTSALTLFIDNVYFYKFASSQTINFPAISEKTVGDPAFALTATASSNLPVSYSTDSDKVTINSSTVTIVNAGRVIIKANQSGNAGFTAAPEVTRSFCIKPAKPTVTFTEPTAGTFLLTSSATAGNKWYKDGTLIASATNSTYSTTTAGIYKVQVTVDDCVSEFSADVPINVKGNQTITFPTITDKTVGNAPFSLTATASSTLAVAYSTDSDKVTISGSTVTIVKAGRVIVKANQAGNNSFNAAPEVTRSFCIKPAKPTVTATGTDVETITLTSSASTGNRWFLNGAAIPSATNATFSANQPGIYKVQVTVDDCVSEFSSDLPLIVTGDLAGNAYAITVYPNPAQDYLELAGINGELSNVQLVDLAGRRNPIHFEKRGEVYQANVQHLTLGIYLLQVQDGAVIHRIKVIKK
jgi:predicted Zn-dependent protease